MNSRWEDPCWIAAPENAGKSHVFEKKIHCAGKPVTALLRVSAVGLYRVFVNGRDITAGLLTPGWTDYETRIQYQEYDVKELLQEENTLELLTAGGWSACQLLLLEQSFYKETLSAAAELCISYADGTWERITTDASWDVYDSALLYSDHYKGETVDYSRTDRASTAVLPVLGKAVVTGQKEHLVPQAKEPVRPHERIAARELIVTPSGKRVIDFGQNLAGFVEIRLRGRKGERVVLRHVEILAPDGEPYYRNLRTADQRMEYVLGKDGLNILKPLFTFQGYRYCVLEEFPGDADPGCFTSVAVYTDMERTGWLSTGNEKLNRLYDCILWNQRSNFIEVPTDCPQRDERLGWLGDAQAFCKSAAFNYNVYNFYREWLKDIVSGQLPDGGIRSIAPFRRDGYPFRTSAAWADAITIIPWELYRIYGDDTVLRECFDAMCRYVDYLHGAGPEEYLWLEGNHYGDWLALDGPDPREPLTDKNFIASAYFIHSTEIVIACGELLGKDVTKYAELLPHLRRAFRQRFLKDGLPVTDTLAASTLLLHFDLVTEEERPKVAAHLAELVDRYENRLMTGVVGAPYILHALADNGYTEKAFDMLLCEEIPSWLGMLRFGATTLWERLDTYTEDGIKDIRNASFNHYVFGSVLDWIVEKCAGIRLVRDEGRLWILWKPCVDPRIGHVDCCWRTEAGCVRAGWALTGEGTRFTLELPEGLEAQVLLPDGSVYAEKGGQHIYIGKEPENTG